MSFIKCKIEGSRPLLMHADVFADPLNELTKRHKLLTAKRKKTDEDHIEIAKSEWRSSLYLAGDESVIIPTTIVEAALIGAAKLSKLGTLFKRSVEVVGLEIPLIYNGPKSIESLWDKKFYDARSVKVGAAKIMRYRPRFNEWSLEFIIQFDEKNIDAHDVKKALIEAGTQIGICDYRPKFGRFDVIYADEVE